MNKYFFALILLFSFITANAQDMNKVVFETLEDIRNNRQSNNIMILDKWLVSNPKETIDAFSKYLSDSSDAVQQFSLSYIGRAGYLSKSNADRKRAVELLLTSYNDESSLVRNEVGRKLKYFKKVDYTDAAAGTLASYLKGKKYISKQLILLAGYINPSGTDILLRDIQTDSLFKKREIQWACRLALSRVGDLNSINYCINLAKKNGLNDRVVYELVPDLIYTHSKDIYDYLVTLLNSNEKSCGSSNPDSNEKIVCGYRLMEMLAPVINNYPLEVTASGDIKTKDYEAALTQVRKWFEDKKGNYTINIENF